MYEQDQVSVLKRLVALGVIFITVVVLLWWGVWFIWLRDSKKPVAPKRPSSSQTATQSGNESTEQPQAGSGANDPSVSVPDPSQAAQTPAVAPQPTELANTGAGSVLVLVTLVSVVAGVAYEYTLRRRAQA